METLDLAQLEIIALKVLVVHCHVQVALSLDQLT
jgi:hypothetical protein